MKSIKTFVAAAQAEQAGASSYKITQAYSGNRVHMTAELNK
ncbi:YdgH/BhsA/McbA-like domain containing protein [Kluyvera ascorbata]